MDDDRDTEDLAIEDLIPADYDPGGDLVVEAPADQKFHMLKCPAHDGRRRPSFLCEMICADVAWSDDRAKRVRSACPSWKAFLEDTPPPDVESGMPTTYNRDEVLDGTD